MYISVYCDLGPTIGTGHCVRSTALAGELVALGARVTLSADFSQLQHLQEQVQRGGAETVQRACAAEFATAQIAEMPDIVVLDSYLATADDLTPLVQSGVPIVAIDDEAVRALPAHTVINQNLSAEQLEYSSWRVHNVAAELLAGPEYALIRRQFREAREAEYRQREVIESVLVLLGGSDPYGHTPAVVERVLEALSPCEVHTICSNPHTLAALRECEADAQRRGSTLHIHQPRSDIETLMSSVDLTVTAAGSSVWELATLGVPIAALTVAQNQVVHAQAAADAGVLLLLGDADEAVRAPVIWKQLHDVPLLNDVAERAFRRVDGDGARRAAQYILQTPSVRRAELADTDSTDVRELLRWRNDPLTCAASLNQEPVAHEQHLRWVEASAQNPDRAILILESRGERCGVVRFDRENDPMVGRENDQVWEVSITLAPEVRGRGLAHRALSEAMRWLCTQHAVHSITAQIRRENTASQKLFSRCGYHYESVTAGVQVWQWVPETAEMR